MAKPQASDRASSSSTNTKGPEASPNSKPQTPQEKSTSSAPEKKKDESEVQGGDDGKNKSTNLEGTFFDTIVGTLETWGVSNLASSVFTNSPKLIEFAQKAAPVANRAKELVNKAGATAKNVYDQREEITRQVKAEGEKATNRTIDSFGGIFGSISKLTSGLAEKMTGKTQS